jgi:hypothetical protein
MVGMGTDPRANKETKRESNGMRMQWDTTKIDCGND